MPRSVCFVLSVVSRDDPRISVRLQELGRGDRRRKGVSPGMDATPFVAHDALQAEGRWQLCTASYWFLTG